MSRPFYIGAGTVASGTGNVTPGLPTDYQDDDILVLFVNSGNEAITAPAGYTEVTNSPQGTGTGAAALAVRLAIFWKRASGTEAAPTVTDTGDHTIAQILNYRGALQTGTPFGAVAGDVEATSTTAVVAPSVTSTADNSLIIVAVANGADTASTNYSSSATNAALLDLTVAVRSNTSSGNGGGFGIWHGLKRAVGATGTTAITQTVTSPHARITLALNPRADDVPAYISGAITSGTGTAIAVIPTGYQSGDLMLMIVETANEAIATPSGWTAGPDSPRGTGTGGGTSSTRLTLFYKVATSSETGPTISDSADHRIIEVLLFSGCPASVSPFNTSSGDVEASTTTATTFPGLTTTADDCLIVAMITRDTDSASAGVSAWANSDLAYLQEIVDSGSASGNGGGIAAAIGPKYVAGSVGATTATISPAATQGRLVVALLPASAVGGSWVPRIVIF